MARIIDVEPIVKFIKDGLNNPNKEEAFGYTAVQILAEIEYAPTVDAAPTEKGETMDVRKKLAEIIKFYADFLSQDTIDAIADSIIAEGVTAQEWISVKDGLPKLIPCEAGTAYSEAVNVLTTGRKVLTAIWDGIDWICDAEFWDAEDEEITHWTPVLLPLHQPPEGE